jgi:hypothetical protein
MKTKNILIVVVALIVACMALSVASAYTPMDPPILDSPLMFPSVTPAHAAPAGRNSVRPEVATATPAPVISAAQRDTWVQQESAEDAFYAGVRVGCLASEVPAAECDAMLARAHKDDWFTQFGQGLK